MDWIRISETVLPAVIAGTGGYWAHWKRSSEQRADYETLKKMRRLVGAGDVEKMQRAEMLTRLAIEQEKHGLTGQKWEDAKARILGAPKKRTTAETTDPPPPELGRYGGKVEYLENGDKVELIELDSDPPTSMVITLRKNDNDILAARDLYENLMNWRRFQKRKAWHDSGKPLPKAEELQPDYEETRKLIKAIEEKYGKEKLEKEILGMDDFEFSSLIGQYYALAWVMGKDTMTDYNLEHWDE